MEQNGKSNTKRILYFDIARFFAIFGVIMVHVGLNSSPSLFLGNLHSFGRFGVQLFFLISGATVYLTYNKSFKSSQNPLKDFYVKRFFRIIPLFIVMAFIYYLLDDKPFYESLIPYNGFNPNVYNNIEGGWSIWNEMYFYLIFPIYFNFRKSKLFNISLPLLFVSISILINFRFFGYLRDSEMLLDFDYLNFFTQFICFIIGVEYVGKNYFNLFSHVSVYFILGIVIKFFYFYDMLQSADYGASYWTPIVSLIALVFVISLKFITNIPRLEDIQILNVLSFLGKKTYTTYMIHFLIIRFLAHCNISFVFEIQLVIVSILSFGTTLIIERFTEQYWVSMGRKIINTYSH